MNDRAQPQPLTAHIASIGVLGPGIADWPAAAALLRAEQAYQPEPTVLPAPELLPPAERRRATPAIKLTLAAGLEAIERAGRSGGAADLPTVFAASGGDGFNCHAICEALAGADRFISPTRFHNSVHNAASGYWGIATRSMAPSAVLSAPHDGSFAAGLLEAMSQVATGQTEVLLLVYDTDYPEPLRRVRPIPDNFAVALLLSPTAGPNALARLLLSPQAAFTDRAADALAHSALEDLRQSIPAARALPLLQRLAQARWGAVCLDHAPGQRLQVHVESC